MPLDTGPSAPTLAAVSRKLDFLWIELTNRCNLRCVHCYTDSGPETGVRDRLDADDYRRLMRDAYALGCRKLQFIGGEPQLNADFLALLVTAREIGFTFIEVFTNLTRLAPETLAFARENGIRFATSVYSDRPEAHDAVTRVRSSHARTVGNLRRLVADGVATRAAIIAVDQPKAEIARTETFLRDLGVPHVRSARTQPIGRGEAVAGRAACLDGLCGHCWRGKLCVAPDGFAYACVMARDWPVGNVLTDPLAAIVGGDALESVRRRVHDQVWLPRLQAGACPPDGEPGPDSDPGAGKDLPEPAEECPQSCTPDDAGGDCAPHGCPQSCEPFIVVCEPTVGTE